MPSWYHDINNLLKSINVMKTRLLVLLVLCFAAFATGAQTFNLDDNYNEEDTTIHIVSYFNKGDTMTYQYTYFKQKIEGTDTTTTMQHSQEFMLAVTDSTSSGYRIELTPLDFEYDYDEDSTDNGLANLAWELFKDMKCVFTTNEVGQVTHIENWREISKQLKTAIKSALDKTYGADASMDSIMPRKQLERMLTMHYSTEDGIKEAYEELEMLFGIHGYVYDIGEKEIDDSENGWPQHISASIGYTEPYDEDDYDGDYAVKTTSVTTIPAEEAMTYAMEVAGVLLNPELADTLDMVKDSLLDSIKSRFDDEGYSVLTVTVNEFYGYFVNGWPKMCYKQRDTAVGDNLHNIETNAIIWTSRNWDWVTIKEDDPVHHGI